MQTVCIPGESPSAPLKRRAKILCGAGTYTLLFLGDVPSVEAWWRVLRALKVVVNLKCIPKYEGDLCCDRFRGSCRDVQEHSQNTGV